MSGKRTTKTEMRGTTSRHGKRADAKRLANKVRRTIDHEEADVLSAEAREMLEAGIASGKRQIEYDKLRAQLAALSCELVIAEGEKLLVENDAEIMRRVKMSAIIASTVRESRDLLVALRKADK